MADAVFVEQASASKQLPVFKLDGRGKHMEFINGFPYVARHQMELVK